ncbi:MAG: flagellar protein FlgN [Methylococcaceae bacterium]|nr:flagellar protein FlgN [Methylococcaceae bacterium]
MNSNKRCPVKREAMKPEAYSLLVEILRDTLDEVSHLHELLLREGQVLTDRHADEINSVAKKKQESVNRIRHLTNLQHEFFEAKKLPDGETGLNHYLERFREDDPHTLELRAYRENIKRCLDQCKESNERNGARIELMNRHTRRAIDFLRNQGNQPHTYGPDGNTQQTPLSRARFSV